MRYAEQSDTIAPSYRNKYSLAGGLATSPASIGFEDLKGFQSSRQAGGEKPENFGTQMILASKSTVL
jgi:hypothetical protein